MQEERIIMILDDQRDVECKCKCKPSNVCRTTTEEAEQQGHPCHQLFSIRAVGLISMICYVGNPGMCYRNLKDSVTPSNGGHLYCNGIDGPLSLYPTGPIYVPSKLQIPYLDVDFNAINLQVTDSFWSTRLHVSLCYDTL